MSDTVSFAELDRQHIELLPARTVLSMFGVQDPGGANPGGLTPEQVTAAALRFIGFAPPESSGPAGSANDGNTGASG
ncbi:MAG: hypothetical protein ACRDRO_15050 [Pseudonocardiaceae bacterium]